jgi:hypothetical protein
MRENNSHSDQIGLCSFWEAEAQWRAMDVDAEHAESGRR